MLQKSSIICIYKIHTLYCFLICRVRTVYIREYLLGKDSVLPSPWHPLTTLKTRPTKLGIKAFPFCCDNNFSITTCFISTNHLQTMNTLEPTKKTPIIYKKQKTSRTLVVRLTDSQYEIITNLQKAFGDVTAAAVIRHAIHQLSESLKD